MFLQACKVQVRVVHALVFRELRTRFGRQQLGYIWAFLEPMLFVAVLSVVYTIGFKGRAVDVPVILFLVTGIVPFFLFRQTFTRAVGAILSNRPLLTFPQVTPLDLVIGRSVLEALTMVIVFVVVVVAYAVFGGDPVRIENAVGVVYCICAMSLIGFGAGAFVGSFSIMFPSIERMIPALVNRPLFYTSGMFFTLEMMPEPVIPYLLYNPLLHAIELLRGYFFVEMSSRYADHGYLNWAVLIALFLGLLAQRALRKKILTTAQTV